MTSPARSPPRAVSCSAASTSTATHRSGSVWPGSACSAPPSCWPRPRSPSATSPPGSATASRRSSPRRSRAGTGCRRRGTAPATTADSPPRPDRRARRRPRPQPQAPALGVVAGGAAPKVHALDQRPDVLVLLHDDVPLVLLDDVLGLSKLVSESDHEAPRVGPHAFVLRPGQPDLGLAATTPAFAEEHQLLAARGALPVLRPLHHALVSGSEQDLDLGDPFVRSRHRTFATPWRGGISRARAREAGRLVHAARTPAGGGAPAGTMTLTEPGSRNAGGGARFRTSSDLRTPAVSIPGAVVHACTGRRSQAACATAVAIRSHSHRVGHRLCRRRSARARSAQSEGPLAFARRR